MVALWKDGICNVSSHLCLRIVRIYDVLVLVTVVQNALSTYECSCSWTAIFIYVTSSDMLQEIWCIWHNIALLINVIVRLNPLQCIPYPVYVFLFIFPWLKLHTLENKAESVLISKMGGFYWFLYFHSEDCSVNTC